MPIRGAEYAVVRILATLQTYLAAELDAMETTWADGILLEDIVDWYDYERDLGYMPSFPAITVVAARSTPRQVVNLISSAGRYDVSHEVLVGVHHKDNGNDAPSILSSRNKRTALAIEESKHSSGTDGGRS